MAPYVADGPMKDCHFVDALLKEQSGRCGRLILATPIEKSTNHYSE